jgi:hypothetical protein
MATKTATLAQAEEAYRRAWEADQRASALDMVRGSLPGLEQQVDARKRELGEWEDRLAELGRRRAGFVEELAALPGAAALAQMTAQEEDQIRSRRRDLVNAIAALDGADARGTLVDDLWNQPRIPGTRKRIEEARQQLARAETELEGARRQVEYTS